MTVLNDRTISAYKHGQGVERSGHCLIRGGTISHHVLDRRMGQALIQSGCYTEDKSSYLYQKLIQHSHTVFLMFAIPKCLTHI